MPPSWLPPVPIHLAPLPLEVALLLWWWQLRLLIFAFFLLTGEVGPGLPSASSLMESPAMRA